MGPKAGRLTTDGLEGTARYVDTMAIEINFSRGSWTLKTLPLGHIWLCGE